MPNDWLYASGTTISPYRWLNEEPTNRRETNTMFIMTICLKRSILMNLRKFVQFILVCLHHIIFYSFFIRFFPGIVLFAVIQFQGNSVNRATNVKVISIIWGSVFICVYYLMLICLCQVANWRLTKSVTSRRRTCALKTQQKRLICKSSSLSSWSSSPS